MSEETPRTQGAGPGRCERDYTAVVSLLVSAIATVLVARLLYREARRGLRRLGPVR